jgi:hypothetical protein
VLAEVVLIGALNAQIAALGEVVGEHPDQQELRQDRADYPRLGNEEDGLSPPRPQRSLRQLTNRLVGILHGCLKVRTLYSETVADAPCNRSCSTKKSGMYSEISTADLAVSGCR